MRLPTLASVIAMSLAAPVNAGNGDYTLTIYSSAQPGQINVGALSGYGAAGLPGYALVRDQRRMAVPQGRGEVRFTDVAKLIDPTTVSFASLTDPAGTRVLEQNFQFDLVSAAKLMDRYIGQRIAVERADGDAVKLVEGTLLGTQGALLLQLDSGEVSSLTRYDNVRFPSLPGGLITRPTLVWLTDSARGGEHQAQVAYQTQGMTWWSDYNVTLSETGDRCIMDLSAWVTIVNQSGGSYPQAKLKLVAGEVNRAPAAPQPAKMRMEMMATAAPVDDGFAESSLFEYHLYTLGRRSDLPDNSTKQLELFPAAVGVGCRKQLVFTASPFWYPLWGGSSPNLDQGLGATHKGQVGAFLEFANKAENRMGMPLPAGRVRVNQAAQDGSLEFIGEDLIAHTPRNETLRIKLGNSFDIVGERRQVDFKLDTSQKFLDETFEIEVRNRKQVAAEVVIREYFYRWSGWELLQSTHKGDKRDQQTMDFTVLIPADGTAKVRYTVRYRW
ncbi:MAG: DUF4139 domain-containing protein [Xanthomonadales bacterium]|nr:hypothetical protein [Anaerolineae bacterium]MCC6592713.1 DUF4139 domain-containing protein [Xanthomonadales bacterium]